jgi:hypothetical protein
VKSPFDSKQSSSPFLAPLAARRWQPREFFERVPPFVAPVAVTVIGGIALVVALVAFLSSTADAPRSEDVAAASTPVEAAPVMTDDEPVSDPAAAAPAPAAVSDAPSTTDDSAAAEPEDETPLGSPPAAERDVVLAPQDSVASPIAPDPGRTSSIPPARPGGEALAPQVEIAETDEEIAALEAIQRQEVEADVGAPSDEWTGSLGATEAPSTPRGSATTTRWVNMRSGPSDDAEVLMVVPALEEIEAETGCDWCAVTYDGRDGFIYKTFLSYAEGEPAPGEAATAE